MMARSSEHIPVLLEEVVANIKGLVRPPQFFLDGTFGRGGHTRALMALWPDMKVVALDRDPEAIAFGREHFRHELDQGRIYFVQGNFSNVTELKAQFQTFTGGQPFDAELLDLGVSSPQLDVAERGFSFYNDGPLDMRMNPHDPTTAADIMNTWDESELVELFRNLGEVRRPQRVVSAVVADRRTKPFRTTRDLAGLIERIEGWRARGHHPATQYFLALRLQVNGELDAVSEAILPLLNELGDGGRLLVITFHSLEDRLVKNAFKNQLALGHLVNKKVIQAQWPEKKKNPRARSAKLRVFEKGNAS